MLVVGFLDFHVQPPSLFAWWAVRNKWSWIRGQDSQAALPSIWQCQVWGSHGQNQAGWGLVLGSVQATQGRREAGVSSSPRLLLVSATKWRRAVSAILWHPWKTKAVKARGWDQWMPDREEEEQPNETRLCPVLRPEMVWSKIVGQAASF